MKITLKAARVNAGFSQKAAALKLGVSNKTVSNWEKGKSSPTVLQANELCKLYEVSYDNVIFLHTDSL